MTNQTIGGQLRKARKRIGMTQFDLAEASGLSKNYICLIETGKKSPSLSALSDLADALSVEIGDLIGHDHVVTKIRAILSRSVLDDFVNELKKITNEL